nr:hypothetical protein [Tanacetum cinerariifolium]
MKEPSSNTLITTVTTYSSDFTCTSRITLPTGYSCFTRTTDSYSSSKTSLDSHSDTSSDSSSRHSSSGYAILDSPCDSLTVISARPFLKRCRSPTTSAPTTSPVPGALSPVRTDLLLPRKRIRYFDSETDSEVSSEEGYIPCVPREIGLGVDVEDTRGTDVRVEIETSAEEEAESSARGTIKTRVNRVTYLVVLNDIVEPVREDFPEFVKTYHRCVKPRDRFISAVNLRQLL